MKHTHRGNCQACGALQAIGNKDGLLAKHGYKVAGFGFFNGTCFGSEHLPLQRERTLTDKIIVDLEEAAVRHDASVAKLKAGKIWPKECSTGRTKRENDARGIMRFVTIMVAWDDATESQREGAVQSAICNSEQQAKFARSHIDMLNGLIATIHGTEPVPMKHEEILVIKPGLEFDFTPAGNVPASNWVKGQTIRYQVARIAQRGFGRSPQYAICTPVDETKPAGAEGPHKAATITQSFVMIRRYVKETAPSVEELYSELAPAYAGKY